MMVKPMTVGAIAAIALLATPADAQQKRKRPEGSTSGQYSNQWSQGRSRSDTDSYSSGQRGDTKDDIDARAFDPGGDFAGYPGWARKALGSNKDPG